MLYNGRIARCTWCGTPLTVTPANAWHSEMRGASGQPNMHVIVVDGREVHRCEMADPRYDGGGLVSGAPGSSG